MSLQLARQSYRRAAQTDIAEPQDAHAAIGVALNELQGALDALNAAVEAGLPLGAGPMTKALSALYLLQSSLDFERGGEIAPSLFQVYEFCRLQIVSAFRKEPGGAEGVARAREFIAILRTSWAEMARPA
jgi:flagellar protein FliS